MLQKACAVLPESQRAAVMACFDASKVKSKRGIRYTTQWIYECLLLRIKSRKAYEHLRTKQILALPTVETLTRYTKCIKGTYGFDNSTFAVLKEKTASVEDLKNLRGKMISLISQCDSQFRKKVFEAFSPVTSIFILSLWILCKGFLNGNLNTEFKCVKC